VNRNRQTGLNHAAKQMLWPPLAKGSKIIAMNSGHHNANFASKGPRGAFRMMVSGSGETRVGIRSYVSKSLARLNRKSGEALPKALHWRYQAHFDLARDIAEIL
jgi:hypothetical protein